MALAFLLDENQRGVLWRAIQRINAVGVDPGIFLLRRHTTIHAVVDFLVEAAHASEPAEWRDRIEYIP